MCEPRQRGLQFVMSVERLNLIRWMINTDVCYEGLRGAAGRSREVEDSRRRINFNFSSSSRSSSTEMARLSSVWPSARALHDSSLLTYTEKHIILEDEINNRKRMKLGPTHPLRNYVNT